MVKIIEDYSSQIQEKLLEQMLQQRTQLSDHVKGIDTKINDIDKMILGLATVETRLQ